MNFNVPLLVDYLRSHRDHVDWWASEIVRITSDWLREHSNVSWAAISIEERQTKAVKRWMSMSNDKTRSHVLHLHKVVWVMTSNVKQTKHVYHTLTILSQTTAQEMQAFQSTASCKLFKTLVITVTIGAYTHFLCMIIIWFFGVRYPPRSSVHFTPDSTQTLCLCLIKPKL